MFGSSNRNWRLEVLESVEYVRQFERYNFDITKDFDMKFCFPVYFLILMTYVMA